MNKKLQEITSKQKFTIFYQIYTDSDLSLIHYLESHKPNHRFKKCRQNPTNIPNILYTKLKGE